MATSNLPTITTDTRLYLSAIGARGGSAITPKKRQSSKRNGRLGGRPKKKAA